MKKETLAELTSLFFATRQILRAQLPEQKPDHNAWLRLETLNFIDTRANTQMHDIARYVRVQPPSATSLVATLEREGLVVRKRASGDRRAVHVMLTQSGRKELRGYRATSSRAMRKVFSKLTEREIARLATILRRLHEAHR